MADRQAITWASEASTAAVKAIPVVADKQKAASEEMKQAM